MQAQVGTSAPPDPVARGAAAPAQPGGRSVEIDALRGLALFGIIIVNAPFFAGPLNGLPTGGWLDAFAVWLTGAFFAGKFFLIFSFLFGFGFATLLIRAGRDPSNLRGKFMRRLLALFVFGALHACFLFFGDILMLYAALGLALWFCRNWSKRRLLVSACVVYLLGMALQTLALMAALELTATSAPSSLALSAGYLGGFLDVAAARIAELPDALGFIAAFNGLPALAIFLTGLALGRHGEFPPTATVLEHERRWYGLAMLSGATISAIAMLGTLSGSAGVSAVSFAALAASAPALSFGLVGLGLTILQRHTGSRIVLWLSKAGGSSLSGYVLHSILLGAVFYGWGLGKYGAFGPAAVLAIAVATFLTVLVLLNLWRRFFRYGPDEWLLRSFVDLQWKPIRIDSGRERASDFSRP